MKYWVNKSITDAALLSLSRQAMLDAGHSNISLISGSKDSNVAIVDLSDGEIEDLIRWMAQEILRLRKAVAEVSA